MGAIPALKLNIILRGISVNISVSRMWCKIHGRSFLLPTDALDEELLGDSEVGRFIASKSESEDILLEWIHHVISTSSNVFPGLMCKAPSETRTLQS
jgi:hypothetical protein